MRDWSPVIRDGAVAELRELAGGRADLLAEAAGVQLGAGEGRPDEDWYQRTAELCVAAGADESQIERWAAIGRERARLSSRRPYTGSGEPGLGLSLGPAAARPARRREPGGPPDLQVTGSACSGMSGAE